MIATGPESCLIAWTLPLVSSIPAFKSLGDWVIRWSWFIGWVVQGVLDSTEFNHYLITIAQCFYYHSSTIWIVSKRDRWMSSIRWISAGIQSVAETWQECGSRDDTSFFLVGIVAVSSYNMWKVLVRGGMPRHILCNTLSRLTPFPYGNKELKRVKVYPVSPPWSHRIDNTPSTRMGNSGIWGTICWWITSCRESSPVQLQQGLGNYLGAETWSLQFKFKAKRIDDTWMMDCGVVVWKAAHHRRGLTAPKIH